MENRAMTLSFLFLSALISQCVVYGIIRLFRAKTSSWSIPIKIAVYLAGSYFIFASAISIAAIRAGGEGQLIILFMGFPTVLLGYFLEPVFPLLGQPFEYLVVIFLFMIHSALIGWVLWMAGNFYVKLTHKIPAWNRLSPPGKWGITFAVVHFLIIGFLYSLLRQGAEEMIRVLDTPTIFITLPCETLYPPESDIRFLSCHLLIGTFLYGMIGFFIREGLGRLAGNKTNP
jgi:hypothetical protein